MKTRFLLLIAILLGTVAMHAQRSMTIVPSEQLVCSVKDQIDPAPILQLQIAEIDMDSTEFTVFYESGSVKYYVPICFDTALDMFINAKWVLYKSGYISRRQFCIAKREYYELRE